MKRVIFIAVFVALVMTSAFADQLEFPRQTVGTGKIETIAYSPKGGEIAVGTTIGIEILEPSTLQQLEFLPVQVGEVRSISYEPKEKWLAFVAGEMIFIWSRETKEVFPMENSHNVSAVKVAPKGRILGMLQNGPIEVWEAKKNISEFATSLPHQVWRGHERRTRTIGFALNGKLVASGSSERKVTMRQTGSGKALRSLNGAGSANSIIFTADSRRIIVASVGNVRLWNSVSGEILKTLRGRLDGWNFQMATDRKHSKFVIADSEGNVEILGGDLKEKISEFNVDRGTFKIALHPKGKQLLTATPQQLKLWNTKKGELIAERTNYYRIDAFGFSSDSSRLALSATRTPSEGKTDGDLIVWNVKKGEIVDRWKAHDGTIASVRFSPDGTKIMSRAISDRSVGGQQLIRLWRIENSEHEKIGELPADAPQNSEPSIGKSSDFIAPYTYNVVVEKANDAFDIEADKTYVVMSADRTLELWNAPKKFHFKRAAYWAILNRHQTTSAISKDGHFTAIAKGKEIIAELGNHRTVLQGHNRPIKLLQFSFDGNYLVSLSWDGICVVWDLRETRKLAISE